MTTTADDVWRLLAELIESQKETDRRLQETERLLKQQSLESDKRRQETDRQIQQVNEQIGKLGNRLGEFVEWQIRPACVRLFKEKGIAVREFHPEMSSQRGEEGIEIDLLVVDTTEAIAIEVKSKLSQGDVDEHLERLAKFKRFFPRYQDVNLLGAVAGMVVPSDSARYAYRKGLFVIAPSGDDVVILNDSKFKPKVW
ncbi:hypothetical protein [Geminocystis herdmanii]|uniref:hypothetical protein n=1 Tax=Geminocystis herdmanii TaxID=669359 RepID=UPI00034D5FB9|nr:hypothetical protein [Geminocystis herdmanii]